MIPGTWTINQNQTYSATVPYVSGNGLYEGTGGTGNTIQFYHSWNAPSNNTRDHYSEKEQELLEKRLASQRGYEDFIYSTIKDPEPPPPPAAAKARHGYQMAPRRPGFRKPRTR
jgi:hypothetical protein